MISFGSRSNACPLTSQENPNVDTANASSQNTGLNGLQCIAEQSIHAHQRNAENDYDTADPVCQIPLFLFS